MQDLIIAIGWITFAIFIFKKIKIPEENVAKRAKSHKKNHYLKEHWFNSYYSPKTHLKSREKKDLIKEYKTLKGDIVKSGGEKRIADYLYSIGINYEYEKSFYRKDGGENKPDFYLTDYDIYIEYFGMIGNKKYNYEMSLKFDTFERIGLKVIKIYPTHFKNKTFEKALNVQFKNFVGFYLPKHYNKSIGHRNRGNFIEYYRKQDWQHA